MNLPDYDFARQDYLDTVADADNNARACGEDPSFRNELADRLAGRPAVDAGGSLPLAVAAGPKVIPTVNYADLPAARSGGT